MSPTSPYRRSDVGRALMAAIGACEHRWTEDVFEGETQPTRYCTVCRWIPAAPVPEDGTGGAK